MYAYMCMCICMYMYIYMYIYMYLYLYMFVCMYMYVYVYMYMMDLHGSTYMAIRLTTPLIKKLNISVSARILNNTKWGQLWGQL